MKPQFICEIRRVSGLFCNDRRPYYIKHENLRWDIRTSCESTESGKHQYVSVVIDFIYDYNSSNLWSCDTEIYFRLGSLCSPLATTCKDFCFNRSSKQLYFQNICIDKIYVELWEFEISIRIKSIVGIQEKPFWDFSRPRNIDSEITLRGNGFKLYVDKYPLMCFSPVFREMLSRTDRKNDNELEINDEKHALQTFLRYLYQQEREITYILCVLKLASKYRIDLFLSNVEEELISTQYFRDVVKCMFARGFNLPKLREACNIPEEKEIVVVAEPMAKRRR